MKKRFLRSMSILLSAAMLTMLPVQTYAEDAADTAGTTTTDTVTNTEGTTETSTGSTSISTTAAAQLIKLKKNTTLKYNVTGNSKKEKIRYTVSDGTLTVTINGKTAFTASDADTYTVKLCVLENGRKFFNIAREWNDSKWQMNNRIYRIKGGKLICVKTVLANADKRYQVSRSDVTSVKGNQIIVRYTGTTNITGSFMWKGIYNNTSGYTLKRASNSMNAYYKKNGHKNSWTVNKAFWTYTKANSRTKAFKTKANERVQINKVYSKSNCLWMQITRSDGSIGWVKSPKTVKTINRYFKNFQLSV